MIRFRTQVIALASVSLLAAATASFAAERVDMRAASDNLAKAGVSDLHSQLGMGQGDRLEKVRTSRDAAGLTHTRYNQLYMGIPVWGEQLVVTETAHSKVQYLHGNVIKGLHAELFSVTPNFDADTAIAYAKAMNIDKAGGERVYRAEQSNLVVFVEDAGTPRLAYAVSYFSDSKAGGSPARPTVLVDALSGDPLLKFDGLTTANGTGPGGNQKTGQYHYGTDFPAFNVSKSGNTCTMDNTNVRAVDLKNRRSDRSTTAFSYACYENTYKAINGAYSPINDAYSFGQVVFDMYNAWVGAAPLSFQLKMKVHYSKNYENAYWDGSAMVFGDGKNTFYPLVSLDVSAHEVSHGFTEQNSGLIYSGQSGGMNEAYSDIAGEAAENYMNGTNDFLVGAQIFKANGALRYMANPPQDGHSIGNANDYYSGLDVHYSSGVFNKAFYLLATSGSFNTQKAFKCFARANQNYWTPGSSFTQGAQGVVDACGDLGYGTSAAIAAFAGVGINL